MTKKKIMSILQYVILIILSIISIFPFYWMIVAATNKSVDVSKGTLMIGSHIVENFKSLMASDLNYFGAFKNSIIIAVVTTTLAMIKPAQLGTKEILPGVFLCVSGSTGASVSMGFSVE